MEKIRNTVYQIQLENLKVKDILVDVGVAGMCSNTIKGQNTLNDALSSQKLHIFLKNQT
jgi:hypothetical protein